MESLIGCCTDTHKKVNQDYCETVINIIAGFKGIIIADGIGEHYKAEIGSQLSVKYLKEELEALDRIEDIDMRFIFDSVRIKLFNKITLDYKNDELDIDKSFGTTLICILSCQDEYICAYVGNGSIWHIDGRFNTFGSNHYLPWNAINVLNPHCISLEGKSCLYNFMSPFHESCSPTIFKLTKSVYLQGEILLATTDGIYSNDQVPVAKDSNGTLWLRGEESTAILFETLSKYIEDIDKYSEEELNLMLEEYLRKLKEENLMHDDTTLGVIISKSCLDYQLSIE